MRTVNTAIHPPYYPDARVTCVCGASFTVGATKPDIRVEICAACHPFFTGEKKLIDTRGRVERFTRITEKSAHEKERRAAQKAAPRKKKKLDVLTERQWKKVKLG